MARYVPIEEQFPGEADPPTFLTVAIGCTQAIRAVHERGEIYRNFAPDCVLVDPQNLAIQLIPPGACVADPAYSSPEQTGRLDRWVDHRADLYALGVLFYRLLTGKLPFEAADPLEWAHCHLARVPRPPLAINPHLPHVLSEIVMCLLEKGADDRYQSAAGLLFDLDECLLRWDTSGKIASFELGKRDISDQLKLPHRLYGRTSELTSLLNAFQDMLATGSHHVVLVSGQSGIGKSALIQEVRVPVANERGYFVSGKFDQFKRDVPYAPLAEALSELVRQLLTEGDSRIGAWRADLIEAIGDNASILVDLVPQLELILGKVPPAPLLAPTETKNRFHMVFTRFIDLLATRNHPIVIFLDDLQWLDGATLDVIDYLVDHPGDRYLMLVGAYRDNETAENHPLQEIIGKANRPNIRLQRVHLGPLTRRQVQSLVGDTLRSSSSTVAPLAEIVHERTLGNPFFCSQFLGALVQQRLLWFAVDSLSWKWDADAIRSRAFSNDVVDLVTSQLESCSSSIQETLSHAACLGSSFQLATLARVCDRSADEIQSLLESATPSGLVVMGHSEWRFGHDRIQQAARALISSIDQPSTHLRIGRILAEETQAEDLNERIFDITGQFNLALAAVDDPSEQDQIAAFNLVAARKAQRSAAFGPAAEYAATGIRLLGPRAWNRQYRLATDLNFVSAECQIFNGRLTEAAQAIQTLKDHVESRGEKTRCARLEIDLLTKRGESMAALQSALESLRLFDLEMTLEPDEGQIEEAEFRLRSLMAGRTVEELADLPYAEDDDIALAVDNMCVALPSAYFVSDNLHRLLACHIFEFALRYGLAPTTPMGLGAYGFELSMRHELTEAARYGRVVENLVSRPEFVVCRAKAMNLLGSVLSIWAEPLTRGIEQSRTGIVAGRQVGDSTFACLCAIQLSTIKLAAGHPLMDVARVADESVALARSVDYDSLAGAARLIQNFVGCMFGVIDPADEQIQAAIAANPLRLLTARHLAYRLMSHVIFDERELAIDTMRQLAPVAYFVRGQHMTMEIAFYSSLAMIASWHDAAPEQQREWAKDLDDNLTFLRLCADACPQNFLHFWALVAAEIGRIRSTDLEPMRLYEAAIQSATANGYLQIAAIANERTVWFGVERELTSLSTARVREAHVLYEKWGASEKVRRLEAKHPWLVADQKSPAEALPSNASRLDTLALVKASQAVSEQIVLEQLIDTLMKVVLETAGGQSGALVLLNGDEYGLIAVASTDHTSMSVRVYRESKGNSVSLPTSMLNYVRRTQERVLLNDGKQAHPFWNDAYLSSRRPKSVLCLPVLRKSTVIGLLYVENNLVADGFSPDRVEVLEILAAQAAISLENSLLYDRLQQENVDRKIAEAQVRKLNDELERRVEERTAELSAVNGELESFSYSVSHDLRTPLRSINALGSLLMAEHGDHLNAEGQDYIRRLRAATERMGNLIDALLDLSRVTRAPLNTVKLDLSKIAAEIVFELQSRDPDRTVTTSITPGLRAVGDPRLVRSVLENLIGNAWKYSKNVSAAQIEFGMEDERTFFVRDNGAGFEMSYADKLFLPFSRLHAESEFKGAGIGLATVKRIVERHGGEIWAQASPMTGATFYFTLSRE